MLQYRFAEAVGSSSRQLHIVEENDDFAEIASRAYRCTMA